MFRSGLRRQSFMLISMLFAVSSAAFAQLPDSFQTPGKTVKATSAQVCAPDFSSSVKPIAPRQKEDALSRYGVRADAGREVFQLIPSSLGGSNDAENLWPLANSREFGPAQKQALDEKLHGMVCEGTLTLKQAQDALKKNWVTAYQKYVTPQPVAAP